MVLASTNTTSKSKATVYFVSSALFLFLATATDQALGQDHTLDFVDAFAPTDASASAFHNEKFREAEKALLEGLGGNNGGDQRPEASPRQQPHIQPVSVTSDTVVNNGVGKVTQQAVSKEADRAFEAVAESLSSGPSGITVTSVKPSPPSEKVAIKGTDAGAQGGSDLQRLVGGDAPGTRTKTSKAVQAGKARPQPQKNSIAHPIRPAPSTAHAAENESAEHEAVLQQLRRELAKSKSDLAAAELEISRLSALVQDASRARLSGLNAGQAARIQPAARALPASPSVATEPAPQRRVQVTSPAANADPSDDLQVATVAVDKAELRLGPGRNHSALMSLRSGSRLVVEARQGEWYRVFAPNGQRAWIHSSLVRFGDGAASLNDGSSVKVRGYDSQLR